MADFSDRPDLETLVEAHRYGAVGGCVNGVTHDVNNALGVILAYAELIEMESNLQDDARRMLADMVGASRAASDQLAVLTSLARPGSAKPALAAPADMLERAVALVRFMAKRKSIRIAVQSGSGLPRVELDIPAMERAILHLLLNAIEASSDHGGSQITCSATAMSSDIVLAVRDEGPPIDDEIASRMFEPMFTTKGGGDLGLGLFTASKTAEKAGGRLAYDPDGGFMISLPRVASPEASQDR